MKPYRLMLLAVLLLPVSLHSADFKRVSDGVKNATATIQEAIDKCSANGGGEVVIPDGQYLCKTIFLRDNVTLRLSRGAVIKGDLDYTQGFTGRAIIYGENVENAGICGDGMIDGQANYESFISKGYANNDKFRPYSILFLGCKNISVKDITIVRSPRWTIRIRECEKVRIDGVVINSMEFINSDGIDIEAKDVVISNCIIDSDDDSICFKSDNPEFMVQNVCVTNCVLASNSNAIKFGTSSRAGFRNVAVSNCVIRAPYKSVRRNMADVYRNIPQGTLACHSGIAIECVDGGLVENITLNNITMEGIVSPIFLCINKRKGIVGTMRNINISNINAVAEGVIPCLISGIPEGIIENVSLVNINVVRKSWDVAMTESLPENYKSYPECRMYGHKNPACGLYVRHVKGLIVSNFRLTTPDGEQRPWLVLEDVRDQSISGSIHNGKPVSE